MAKAEPKEATKDVDVTRPIFSVVHIQTNVQAVLGVVNPSGDVIEKVPITFEISRLEPAQFEALLNGILQAKARVADVKNNEPSVARI
jgi:hypothetical protein